MAFSGKQGVWLCELKTKQWPLPLEEAERRVKCAKGNETEPGIVREDFEGERQLGGMQNTAVERRGLLGLPGEHRSCGWTVFG